jgi:putative ABC transport system ATP-binding protein
VIETQGLAYTYAGTAAAIGFPDICVAQGGTLLLRGASGSGKSTWLALVAGLLAATSGKVAVAGQDLVLLRGAQRDAWRAGTIGFLPQRLHLSAALTVAQNCELAYFAAGRAVDAQAIHHALGRLGVADLAARRPASLSGGQAQRVALARAVLLGPQVLLADEPTASLDDDAATAALALLQEAAAFHQATLVIATHDARVAKALPGCVELTLKNRSEKTLFLAV